MTETGTGMICLPQPLDVEAPLRFQGRTPVKPRASARHRSSHGSLRESRRHHRWKANRAHRGAGVGCTRDETSCSLIAVRRTKVALTESLALEVARDNILVNAIAPGPIVPPPDMSQEEIDEVAKATPVGHWGGEAEIAKAVVLLCETDFITGETIRVDGGRHLE